MKGAHAKFGILHSPQSPDIGQNSDGGSSDFLISGESLTKRNCLNSRTSDGIDMKLGLATKLGKRKETKLKRFGDDFMSEIVTSLLLFQFTAKLK